MNTDIYQSAEFGSTLISDSKLGTEGAEGTVLQVGSFIDKKSIDASEYCAKLYTKKSLEGTKSTERLRKLWAMIQHHKDIKNGVRHSYGWPLSELKKNGKFVGFLMKRAKKGSCSLGEFMNPNSPTLKGMNCDFDTDKGRRNRLALICNIAAGVRDLHSSGHVFVDFKPSNILVHPSTFDVMFVDLDSIQLSNKYGKFLAPLGTPEFMPPEAYIDAPEQHRSPTWDYFSMAVIFYKMLTGIHPYCGTPKEYVTGVDTLEDKIKSRMYVGGPDKIKYQVIPPPHDKIRSYYSKLETLFMTAFQGSPSHRPTATAWGKQVFEVMKLFK